MVSLPPATIVNAKPSICSTLDVVAGADQLRDGVVAGVAAAPLDQAG